MKQSLPHNLLRKYGVIKSDFDEVFFKNEFSTIREKSNFALLLLLTIFTFLALGFALGGLQYIKDKMDDPLNNWENIPYTKDNKDDLEELVKSITQNPADREKYSIKNVQDFSTNHIFFKNARNRETYAWLRTISFAENEVLKNHILLQENRIENFNISDSKLDSLYNTGKGIIVTADFIEKLGYDAPLNQRRVLMRVIDEGNIFFVYKDVLAILKRIPGPDGMTLDFICTPLLYENHQKPDKTISEGNTELNIISDLDDIEEIKTRVAATLGTKEIEVSKKGFLLNEEIPHFQYNIRQKSNTAITNKQKIVDNLQSQHRFNSFHPYVEWNISQYAPPINQEAEYASFVFNSFRDIELFRDSLERKYPSIKISTVRVQQRKNYYLVNRLTFALAILLYIFGLISNLSMIVSMLNSHLKDNRMNFGTFKAFGLNNSRISRMYLTIVGIFIAMLILPAIAIGVFVHLLFSPMMFDLSSFDFVNIYIFSAIAIFVILLFLRSKKIIERELFPTPGQLIHNRKN